MSWPGSYEIPCVVIVAVPHPYRSCHVRIAEGNIFWQKCYIPASAVLGLAACHPTQALYAESSWKQILRSERTNLHTLDNERTRDPPDTSAGSCKTLGGRVQKFYAPKVRTCDHPWQVYTDPSRRLWPKNSIPVATQRVAVGDGRMAEWSIG